MAHTKGCGAVTDMIRFNNNDHAMGVNGGRPRHPISTPTNSESPSLIQQHGYWPSRLMIDKPGRHFGIWGAFKVILKRATRLAHVNCCRPAVYRQYRNILHISAIVLNTAIGKLSPTTRRSGRG